MSELHTNLYNALVKLTEEPETSFEKVVLPLDDKVYHAFTYSLPSYSDFKKPNARESRGIMFEVDSTTNEVKLASLTPAKFFNYKENPFTINLDISKIDVVMNKFDGSMMSTFLHNGEVRLKSKANLTSEHAVAANDLLNAPQYVKLKNCLQQLAEDGYTVTLEHISPNNQIVLYYPSDSLVVLSARNHADLSQLHHSELKDLLNQYNCEDTLVENLAKHYENDFNGFLESVKNMKGDVEGFVVTLKDGETFKLKTDAYHHLHKNKDSVSLSPKNLFEAAVLETSDDLKAMYADEPEVVKLFEDMEDKVRSINRDIKKYVHDFYNQNKQLEKRDFAVKAKAEVPDVYFPLLISAYINPDKPIEFKNYLIKNYKNFGVKDIDKENTQEVNGVVTAKKIKKIKLGR